MDNISAEPLTLSWLLIHIWLLFQFILLSSESMFLLFPDNTLLKQMSCL